MDSLTVYFSPKVNQAYEIYNFRQAEQKADESLDSFHTRSHRLAQTCTFSNCDTEIKQQIILSCKSQRLRRRRLQEDQSLADILNAGRAFETSEKQAAHVEEDSSDELHALKIKQSTAKYPDRSKERFNSQRRNRKEDGTDINVKPSTATCYI